MRLRSFGHCVQITFFPGVFPVNCYLVKEADSVTLIDTGLPLSVKGILKAVDRTGLPITRIVLTHGHGDHVGGLDGIRALVPDAEVLISERDSRLLVGDTELDAHEAGDKIKGDIRKCQTKPTGFIRAGEHIGSLKVVASPGHTPGHLAFLDTRDGSLIAGDAFQTQGGLAVSGILRPFFPFPALATWHAPTALQSARELRDLSPTVLAVGHGNVIHHPVPAMNRAIALAESRLEGDGSSGIKTGIN